MQSINAAPNLVKSPFRFIVSLILGSLALTPTQAHAQKEQGRRLRTDEIAELAVPATATILAIASGGDTLGQGSGFVIRADGVIVTNFHVLKGAATALVIMSSGERFSRVRVIDADSVLDLALLKVPGAAMPTLPTRTTIPRVGERVVAIGSPLGLARTVTEGIVSAARMVEGRELVQVSAAISPGSSGGAVLDAFGRVFAISTSYLEAGQSLNFAVPVRYALGMLGYSSKETSVAAVFGNIAPEATGVSLRQSRSTNGAADEDPGVTRTPHPHESVDGSYSLSLLWTDSKGETTTEQYGYLFATEQVGYIALASRLSKDERGPTKIYSVRRWRTNAIGDVILVAGGTTFDGFQTKDDGFLAFGYLNSGTDSARKLTLGGVPAHLPLSRNDGLYSLTSRAFYVATAPIDSDPYDWTGEAAIAFANDSIYLNVFLKNARGGTTAFIGNGSLTNHESFELFDDTGSSIVGRVSDGHLSAEFFDKREKGAFKHSINGDRR